MGNLLQYSDMRIFVQIASYRDPQLKPTIINMLETAEFPDRLRIGICRQYHPEDGFDDLSIFKEDPRFRIIDVLYSVSRGACWARHLIQQVYDNEEYTLQIDAHMRFEVHWDSLLLEMIRGLQGKGYKKPILTGYVPGFDPAEPFRSDREYPPSVMAFVKFMDAGSVIFGSEFIPDWEKLISPVPARFYAAGFCFTIGSFCREVQHDPDLYFQGEEITLAVRAYTNGYDLFHPHRTLVWHQYKRDGTHRHWDDFKSWSALEQASQMRVRQLLGIDGERSEIDFGKYGLGTVRTLEEYERFAGIRFSNRGIQKHALDTLPPPDPIAYGTTEHWLKSFQKLYNPRIKVYPNDLPEKDYDVVEIAFYNKEDQQIHAEKLDLVALNALIQSGTLRYEMEMMFYARDKPEYWILKPHSLSAGWCRRLKGNVDAPDVSHFVWCNL
jgi:hypothetical protein